MNGALVTESVGVLFVLAGNCALWFYLEKKTGWRLFNFIPPLIFIYIVPAFFSNLNLIPGKSPVYDWIVQLARAYPGDVGILSPALLNLVCLDPGQAMYLPAGQLHAYLDGVGIELMANSDNVLRGGLTPKHVDLPELLRVVRFEATQIGLLEPVAMRPGESGYRCPAEEFLLTVIRATDQAPYFSSTARSVEILLCTSGGGALSVAEQTARVPVGKGDSFLVPAGLSAYTIRGDLTVYKAAVPIDE